MIKIIRLLYIVIFSLISTLLIIVSLYTLKTFLFYSIFLLSLPSHKPFIAFVYHVIDGDTIKVFNLKTRKSLTIRFAGIDCPESVSYVQKAGLNAKYFTKKRIFLKFVIIIPQTITYKDYSLQQHTKLYYDKYNRLIAYIFYDNGKCLNANLVKNGLAIFKTYGHKQYCQNYLLRLEKQAIVKHINMWQ